ncbi:hypothetical protein FHG87_012550 [Trinorchestia longiramus]|nr:hypothetical protein FHG87_012550 [Trinorchestia longiramus]
MASRLPLHLGLLVLLVLLLEGVQGFLGRGAVMEGHDDPLGVLCSEFDPRTPVWTHREITREGVRRAFVEYCENVPMSRGEFNYRYGMTLEEVYQEKYGADASPKRFLLALEDIVDAGAETDAGSMSYQPMYHFNNEQFSESQALLEERWRRVVAAVQAKDMAAARYLLGLSLASLQDFYAHSNWVELGNEKILHGLGLPGGELPNSARYDEETCHNCPPNAEADCVSQVSESIIASGTLTSDYLLTSDSATSLPGKCTHPQRRGGDRSTRVHNGLNKDLPTACFSPRPDLHTVAAQLAAEATSHYLSTLRHAVGNLLFSQLLSLNPTSPIAICYGGASDVISRANDVTTIISSFLNQLQTQHKNMPQPPDDYLLILFSNSLLGGSGVYRSNSPYGLKEALQSSRFEAASTLINGPFSALHTAAHYALPDTELFLITEAVPDTLDGGVSPIHIRELLLQKRIKVTPLVLRQDGARVPRSPVFGLDDSTPTGLGDSTPTLNQTSDSSSNDLATPPVAFPATSPRIKRQVVSASYTYQALTHMAIVTGSHVVDVQRNDESKLFAMMSKLPHAQSLLYRDLDCTTAKVITIPVDNRLQKIWLTLYGNFSTAMLSYGDEAYALLQESVSGSRGRGRAPANAERVGSFSLWTQDLPNVRHNSLKFSYSPADRESVSVMLTGLSATDVAPAFYYADADSLHPSLQRLPNAPAAGWRHFVDIVTTGIDPSGLTRVKSVEFQTVADGGSAYQLSLHTTQPRRNTYFRLDSPDALPRQPFSVVYKAKDSRGTELVRISQQMYLPTQARVTLMSGREVWGKRGARLFIPFSITNTGEEGETYSITAADVMGFPIALPNRSVKVESNESVTVSLYLNIPKTFSSVSQFIDVTSTASHHSYSQSQQLKFDVFNTRPVTNSLVVTVTSTKGTSSSVVAYVIVSSDVRTTDDKDTDDGDTDDYYDEYERLRGVVGSRGDGDRYFSKKRHFLGKLLEQKQTDHKKSLALKHTGGPKNGHHVARKEIPISNAQDDVAHQLHPRPILLSERSFNDYEEEQNVDGGLIAEKASRHISPPESNSLSVSSLSVLRSNKEQLGSLPANPGFVTNHEKPQATDYYQRLKREAETNPWVYETNLSPYYPQRFGRPSLTPLTEGFVGAAQRLMSDTTSPTIEVSSYTPCLDYNKPNNCNQRQWTATVTISDNVGLQSITTEPYREISFRPGTKVLPLNIRESCCDPYMVFYATDVSGLTTERVVGEQGTVLGAGAITGIVIGCVVLLIIIVLAIVFIVRKRRSKQAVELRSQKVRTTEH